MLYQNYEQIFHLHHTFSHTPQIDDEDDDEVDEESRFCGDCCIDAVPKLFDYDKTLIPEEPNFFTAGYMANKEDK